MTDDKPESLLLQPKNTMPRINAIWAFVSVDAKDGNEGLCAAPVGGMLMPLIAADEARLKNLRPLAEQLARMSGMTIKLVKFETRTEVERISGGH